MLTTFRYFIALFGVVCGLIAIWHIAIGPPSIPGGGVVNATTDSQERFFATFFLGFGAALVWCSADLRARSGLLSGLLVIFFLGGVARIVSAVQFGFPHELYTFLGAVELVLPPLLWWWRRAALAQ